MHAVSRRFGITDQIHTWKSLNTETIRDKDNSRQLTDLNHMMLAVVAASLQDIMDEALLYQTLLHFGHLPLLFSCLSIHVESHVVTTSHTTCL